MAIALTDFEGFCGFRPLSEMHKYLDAVPEFAQVVNAPVAFVSELAWASQPSSGTTDEETRSWVRGIFGRLMRAQSTTYKTAVIRLAARYRQALDDGKASELEVEEDVARLVVRLNEQYPADIGVLCTFVLNVVHLSPGQAMFLGANEPHAYLRGEIVECMAASDNVVRAGLTPKERDVETLVEMLTYSTGGAEKQRMSATAYTPAEDSANAEAYASPKEKEDGTPDIPTLLYDPPIEEFSVLRTCLAPGASETQKPLDGPSILLVTQGANAKLIARPRPLPQEQANGSRSRSNSAANGHTLAPDAPREFEVKQPGHTYFVGAGCEVELRNEGDEELVVFRAFVEVPADE
jgi:mannose-6-phosphate isomerase